MFRKAIKLISISLATENRRRLRLVLTAALCTAAVTTHAEPYRCAEDKHLVGACFQVHGRLYWTASTRLVLWPVGTKRLLGVQYPGDMPVVGGAFVDLPSNLDRLLNFRDLRNLNNVVYGDFRVCPFTESEPKVKQYVCIESADHLVAVKPDE